jgi:hypothetical protein
MRAALAILSAILWAGAALAADVTATISPSTAHVGDTLRLEIAVTGTGNRPVLFPVPSDSAFEILRVDSSQIAQARLAFTLALYDTGKFTLGEMPVVVGRGAEAETLWTNPVPVTIRSILPDTAQALQPIKPYRKHPFQWRELLAWIWIPALVVISLAAWWLWRRYRKKSLPQAAVAKPLLPPHEEAARDLIALRDKKYPARGMLKEFFVEYSHIMRRYLERRYDFPALEMTTFDLESELEDGHYDSALRDRLLPALRASDLVKFAKFLPDPNGCAAYIDLGFELVDLTKERPQPETVEEKAA